MAEPVFADTAGLGALLADSEPRHEAAGRLVRALFAHNGRLVTTNPIICELTALAHRLRIPHHSLVAFVDGLTASPQVDLIHIDPELQTEAWNLLKSRPDKTWSLVDCASFVVMQQRGLTEALTSDHHFVQAGFTALLAG